MNNSKGISLGQKMLYACGDVCLGGTYNILNIFYPIFITAVVKLDPALAGIAFLIARVYDAISDPLIGYVSDRTVSRLGRRKPYILAGALLLLVSYIFLFTPFSGDQTTRFALVLLSYVLFYTVQTIISIPYYAMPAEMSNLYEERTKILTVRLIFSVTSTALCSVLPSILLANYLQDDSTFTPEGYKILSIVFGSVFTLFMIVPLFVKEDKGIIVKPDKSFFKNILTPLKIKCARQYLTLQVLKCACTCFITTVFPYYMTDYLGKPASLTMVLAILCVVEILTLPIWQIVARRTSKAKCHIYSSLVWLSACGASLLISKESNILWVYIIAGVIGFGLGGVTLMPNAMFSDMGDVGEFVFGDRREGTFASFESIVYKIAQAVSVAVIMFVLDFSGYKEGVPTEASRVAVRLMLALGPILMLTAGVIVARLYRLDADTHTVLQNVLDQRKNGIEDTEQVKYLQQRIVYKARHEQNITVDDKNE